MAMTTPLIDRYTLINVEGLRHTQQVRTCRTDAHPEVRDAAEAHARHHSHRLAYAVALSLRPSRRADLTLESGGEVVFLDSDGTKHPMRLHSGPHSMSARVELLPESPLYVAPRDLEEEDGR